MMMFYVLVLGIRVRDTHHSFSRDHAVVLGVIILIWLIVVQLPLWIAKAGFRWRLINDADNPDCTLGPLQFNLRHMLLGTFLLSVALSPARVVLPPRHLVEARLDGDVLVLLAAGMLCNLLVAVPCIWGALLSRVQAMPAGFGWLVYCAVVTGLEFAAISSIFGSPGRGDAVVQIYVMNVVQCVTVVVPLRILRAFGYRMVQMPRLNAATEQDAPPFPTQPETEEERQPPLP